jgi:hypothetical protein
VEAAEKTVKDQQIDPGMRAAFHAGRPSRVTVSTTAMMKTLTLVMMVVVPGGLLVLAAFILARTIARQMQLEQGPGSHRFARAVATVRLRDVWSNARALSR